MPVPYGRAGWLTGAAPAGRLTPLPSAPLLASLTAMISYEWRGPVENAELNVLHAEGFGHRVLADDWAAQLAGHSLGWVTARDGLDLVGFVNVPWDGGVHAFILDTVVAQAARHRGIGIRLVAVATEHARAAGCEWLHVDFDDELIPFYFDGCGFRPTNAGLIALGPGGR
jgi:ribosomal protein S18 acetylase RimI-like enzyme